MYTIHSNELVSQFRIITEKTIQNHEPVCVVSEETDNMVLISEQEYRSLQETLHLLSSPANAERLREAWAEAPEQAQNWQEIKSRFQ